MDLQPQLSGAHCNTTPASNHISYQSQQIMSSSSSQDSMVMNYEHLGNIVVRLLPEEYQAERLPDGRYLMKAAAIGYLAQRLGH